MNTNGEWDTKKIESSPTKLNRPLIYRAIDSLREHYPVSNLCTYFEIFEEHKKGYRYISQQLLRKHGISTNPKTVLRYMRIMGLKSPIRKRRFIHTTQSEINEKARHVQHNVLARNFKAARPLEKLVTDVSYLYHRQGRMFISVIKDLYDNSIVSYSLSKFNDNKLVNDSLEKIFNDSWDSTRLCILHSDRAYQYTNLIYIKKLDALGITISHSRKANCLDNSPCENFFSHLKSESLTLNVPSSEHELIQQVNNFITWYNFDRPQEKLNVDLVLL